LSEEDSATGGVQFLNLGHISSSLITSVKIWATPHLLNSVGQVADGVEDTASHAMHAVHDLKRQLDASWKIAALEMLVAVWAIHRRKLPLDELGKDVREVYQTLLPLLPIGHEGDAVFDLAEVIAAVKAIRV
ncbi:MAG: aromatic amino acid lyase, partial [Pacificibacter sp.]